MVSAQLSPLLDSLKNNCPSKWYGPDLVKEIEWEWAETKAKRDAQRIVVYPKGDMSKWISFKPNHRHLRKYKAQQVNRMQRLLDYSKRARYLITLTVDPKRFTSDRLAHEGLKASWNILRKRVQRINPNVQGITATEPQKNGNPHMHIILWNIHIPNYLKWARKAYEVSTGYVQIQPIKAGNKGAVSYLAKYLGKGSRNNFVLACLSRWKARTLNIFGKELTTFLGPLIQKNSNGEWELLAFTLNYSDALTKIPEEIADIVYCTPEKGPPMIESAFICV